MIPQTVIKADGTIEPFSMEKLQRSMHRAQVDEKMVMRLGEKFNAGVAEMISTEDIRKQIKRNLGKYNQYNEVRYSVRESMIKLGPSGYAFEQFIGQVFEAQGYNTSCGVIIRGECVTHEIDVMASNGEYVDLAECKFHNTFGAKSDIKVALYVWARSQDVRSAWPHYGVKGKPMGNYWLITNTKLTDDAKTYCQCKSMNVISWNYPEDKSLRLLIDKYELYPITSLRKTKKHVIDELISIGIVTLKQLININENLRGIDSRDVTFAKYEAIKLMNESQSS